MARNQSRVEILFQYAARLRTSGMCDADIVKDLHELNITDVEAFMVIDLLDESFVTADSGNVPTAFGCISILVAIGITLASAIFLTQLIRPIVVKIIAIAAAVVAGLAVHVAIVFVMEKLGVKMSKPSRAALPDKAEIKRQLKAANDASS